MSKYHWKDAVKWIKTGSPTLEAIESAHESLSRRISMAKPDDDKEGWTLTAQILSSAIDDYQSEQAFHSYLELIPTEEADLHLSSANIADDSSLSLAPLGATSRGDKKNDLSPEDKLISLAPLGDSPSIDIPKLSDDEKKASFEKLKLKFNKPKPTTL